MALARSALAVRLHERAEACYALAGAPALAEEAHAAARSLAQRLGDEFHVRHLRIELHRPSAVFAGSAPASQHGAP